MFVAAEVSSPAKDISILLQINNTNTHGRLLSNANLTAVKLCIQLLDSTKDVLSS